MANIAIDIDSTLYDFASECREAFFEMAIESGDKSFLKGAYTSTMEWRSLGDVLGGEHLAEAIDRVHANESIATQIPYKHSVRVVNRLHKKHEIMFVTTRKSTTHKATVNWLEHAGFPNTTLICSGQDKAEYLSDCQYLIDDRPKTLVSFVTDHKWEDYRNDESSHVWGDDFMDTYNALERKAFGLWFPYNQALTDVRNILLAPTWRGIEYYLERKEII